MPVSTDPHAADFFSFFCFFFRKHCCCCYCCFWLPSYFILTFDAYVFFTGTIFSTLFLCCVSVSFFVVCSSMKLHWFRNFIILHKIMRLCCLLARARAFPLFFCRSRFRSFRHHETPFHPLLFIFVTMNSKQCTWRLFFCTYFFLLCFFPFFGFFFFSILKSIYHSFIVCAVVFKYTHTQLCSRYTKHQFILIWFCALDERTKAKTKIEKNKNETKCTERTEWN